MMGEPVSEFFATVTTGQAVLIAIVVFLGVQLLEELVDVVRRILGRPADVDVEQLVEEISRLRDVVEAVGHDQLGELERIREGVERIDEAGQ
ncbi:MAG: hypothetical protein ACR2GH_23510 [Pseudonocardia sp.]